jgi:hypothetical protein
MCLAEALLRIPDDATADRLIADKLRGGDWAAHVGRSDSLFVNASTWGLMLTGRLIDLPANWRQDAGGWLKGFTLRLGEPVVRQALRRGMQIIGGEFILGAGTTPPSPAAGARATSRCAPSTCWAKARAAIARRAATLPPTNPPLTRWPARIAIWVRAPPTAATACRSSCRRWIPVTRSVIATARFGGCCRVMNSCARPRRLPVTIDAEMPIA